MQPTHEGVTVAEIRAGEFADIHLYLSKASGTANVCVVIEGMAPPPCANDTIPPPPPDTTLISHCWYVGSDSVTGQLTLYDTTVGGYMGVLVTNAGTRLPVTTWASFQDTLSIIVIRAGMDKKWRLSGTIQGGLWTGSGVGLPLESPFSFYGKQTYCQDTLIDTLPPPKDTSKAGRIPSPISSMGETTLCFEMQLHDDTRCKIEGYAKMSFFAGRITHGNITIAEGKGETYSQTLGSYDQTSINIQTVRPFSAGKPADSLMLDGSISIDRTMAKGEFIRLPSEKKGIWSMTSVVCGSWTPVYPDSSCSMPK